MIRTDRYLGLQQLYVFGLPTPKLHVVERLQQLKSLRLKEAKHGWTIRTCRRDGRNEQNLFYRNRISRSDLVRSLAERLRTPRTDEFYIVYPSWSFLFSCNVVLRDFTYVFEGVYGSQKVISSGAKRPDFGFSIPFGLRSDIRGQFGDLRSEVVSRIGRLLFYLKRLPFDSFYTEVACTHTHELIFYELWILSGQGYQGGPPGEIGHDWPS